MGTVKKQYPAEGFPVADFHCDALSKLMENPALDFKNGEGLDVSGERLASGGVVVQCFAVYISEKWGVPRFEHILRQIELYRSKVTGSGDVRPLLWKEQALELQQPNAGAARWGMLSLEGVDGLESNLFYAEVLYELGVRFMGLTWNYANWAADGVLEERKGGFTKKGRTLVDWCNRSGMLLDVSHLSETGFWQLTEQAKRPFIASHSNAQAVCGHPRNLTDDQIKAVIAMNGRIGLNFYPWFVSDRGKAKADDLLRHIEHISGLGGGKNLMFGSDFDGIDVWVEGLEHPGCYPALAERLLRHYPENLVRGWFLGNAASYLAEYLPTTAQ